MLLDLKEFSHTRLLPRQRARTITRWTSPVQFRLGIKATVCGCRSAQWMNRDDDGLLWYCKVTILWPFIRLEKYRALIITTGGTGDEWVDGVPYLSTGHFFSHSSASSFYLWGRVTQWPASFSQFSESVAMMRLMNSNWGNSCLYFHLERHTGEENVLIF